MDTLEEIEQRLARVLEKILVLIFGFFLCLTVIIVVFRFGFNYGIIGSDELVRKSFMFTSAIGGAVGIARHEHIAITFFIDAMPRLVRMVLYVLGIALVALINLAMIWYAWDWIATTGSYPWQPFNLPKVIVTAAIPIGCGLAVIFCVFKIVLTLAGRKNIDVIWLPEE